MAALLAGEVDIIQSVPAELVDTLEMVTVRLFNLIAGASAEGKDAP